MMTYIYGTVKRPSNQPQDRMMGLCLILPDLRLSIPSDEYKLQVFMEQLKEKKQHLAEQANISKL